MSAPDKLRGGKSSELTKLKEKWRTLAEDVQEYWREQLLSSRSQADLRKEISGKLGVKLNWDKQLNQFRAWLESEDERLSQADRMQDNERHIQELHPDWSADQVREEVIRQACLETLATGNYKLGLSAVKVGQNEKALQLDRDKFEFDAAKACLKKLPELKAVSERKVPEREKINSIRELLFLKE